MEAERESRTKNDAHHRTTEPEKEVYSEREQETESNIDHAYQPVGSRALILGTRLHGPAGEEEKQSRKPQQLITRTSRDGAEQEDYIIQDDVEYADDAQLFMKKRRPWENVWKTRKL